MHKTELKVKTTAMVGAPEQAAPDAVRKALVDLVVTIGPIQEAHLAEVHIPGMIDPAELTLVVVVDQATDEGELLRRMDKALNEVIPDELDLGVWPLHPDDEALPSIRSLNCQINATD